MRFEVYIMVFFGMIKSRRMRWTGNGAHMGRRRMHIGS
jgi:hypothetical protein